MRARPVNCAWRFVTLWTVARQVLCPWGFSRWEYWNVLSCPPPRYLPHPGIEPVSPVAPELQQILYKPFTSFSVSSVQSLSRVWLFATPWTAARQASLSITNSQTPRVHHVHCVSDPIQPSIPVHPFLLLPSIFPSIRVFSNESALHIRWPKYWSFSFNINPSNAHPGLISFWMDWLELLAVQGTLKSLLQHHSSKSSILQHSAFLIVQLSHPYITTGKTIALTGWNFVDKVMFLLFNKLYWLVIIFLPRSKFLLISWLQSPSAVIFEPRKIKSATVSTVSPSICHEVMGPDALIIVFWMLSFSQLFTLLFHFHQEAL